MRGESLSKTVGLGKIADAMDSADRWAIIRNRFLTEEAREAGDGEIGLKEFLRRVGGAEDGFGGQVAAADGAFHGGGPPGGGPITCEEQAGRLCFLRGAPMVNAGFGRKRCSSFLDDGGFDELRFACCRQGLADFLQAQINNILAGLSKQAVGSTDDQLKILSFASNALGIFFAIESGFVEDPLGLRVQHGDERLGSDLAVEPEVDSGDGQNFNLFQMSERWVGGANFRRQQIDDAIVREREDE